MNKCRCDERLQTKTKEFTRLPYTGLVLELEHLKIETRLIIMMFASGNVNKKYSIGKGKKNGLGSRKTFSNLLSGQTTTMKNIPQVTVVSRSGGEDTNKTLFPIQPDPRRGSKRGLNHVRPSTWQWEGRDTQTRVVCGTGSERDRWIFAVARTSVLAPTHQQDSAPPMPTTDQVRLCRRSTWRTK
jgi:hypothetical protein